MRGITDKLRSPMPALHGRAAEPYADIPLTRLANAELMGPKSVVTPMRTAVSVARSAHPATCGKLAARHSHPILRVPMRRRIPAEAESGRAEQALKGPSDRRGQTEVQ